MNWVSFNQELNFTTNDTQFIDFYFLQNQTRKKIILYKASNVWLAQKFQRKIAVLFCIGKLEFIFKISNSCLTLTCETIQRRQVTFFCVCLVSFQHIEKKQTVTQITKPQKVTNKTCKHTKKLTFV